MPLAQINKFQSIILTLLKKSTKQSKNLLMKIIPEKNHYPTQKLKNKNKLFKPLFNILDVIKNKLSFILKLLDLILKMLIKFFKNNNEYITTTKISKKNQSKIRKLIGKKTSLIFYKKSLIIIRIVKLLSFLYNLNILYIFYFLLN